MKSSCALVLSTLLALTTVTSCTVSTSSVKVQEMLAGERWLLDQFQEFVDQRTQAYTRFHEERQRQMEAPKDMSHPNVVYLAIRKFFTGYTNILGQDKEEFQQMVEAQGGGARFAKWEDVKGAISGLLRVQFVYGLKAADMAKGDYRGYQGPHLEASDAYEIGKVAFSDGKMQSSQEWLTIALTLLDQSAENPPKAAVIALLGRAYAYNKDLIKAAQCYQDAYMLDPVAPDVDKLAEELSEPPLFEPEPIPYAEQNFTYLCNHEKENKHSSAADPRITCRYKAGYLPYYRFKEEILSVQPFATMFYDFISDSEAELLKKTVEQKNLYASQVEGGVDAEVVSEIRSGYLGWVHDVDHVRIKTISLRIEQVTRLNLQQTETVHSSEAFQVVNYGIGGHYSMHMDPLTLKPDAGVSIEQAGDRIATFLLYLNDVEKGGNTVFPRAGVVAVPTKNAALMWYNFSPRMVIQDMYTEHGGCPVLIGEKWIANKWVWTYGNTFKRRCGLNPYDDQMDIDDRMASNWT